MRRNSEPAGEAFFEEERDLERLAMSAEEKSYASDEDLSPAKKQFERKGKRVIASLATARPHGPRLWVTPSRGAGACRPSAASHSVAAVAFCLPAAFFVGASAAPARVSARDAGAAVVVSDRLAVF